MLNIKRGRCHAIFAYDAAFSIDLNEAERRITAMTQRETIKHKRRAPKYFQYQPPPLRVSHTTDGMQIGNRRTNAIVEVVLYDFGGLSVNYQIPFEGSLEQLQTLSSDLYENAALLEDSEKRVRQLLEALGPAVSKPNLSSFVEDYVMFQIEESNAPHPIEDVVRQNAGILARILRAETRDLSEDEIKDALSHRISFSSNDITILDWNAAILFDPDADDSLVVLEFANVELMEMRYLDRRLDQALGIAYEALSKRSWRPELQKVAQWQVDSAILFEGVNNALKLVGDQYLARLYRLTAERFHLAEWDASIIRKLETLNSIYGKLADQISSRRMEMLEWIIIVLFVVSILLQVLPFFSSFSGH